MSHIHEVSVCFEEIKRTAVYQEACEALVTEFKRLLATGHSLSILGTGLIKSYLVDDDQVQSAIASGSELGGRYRLVYRECFNDVIIEAHRRGWMQSDAWVATALLQTTGSMG